MSTIENFAELFEQSISGLDLRPGSLVKAKVVDIRPDWVTVSGPFKSDPVISADQFRNDKISVGDEVDVVIESLENGFGETRLSREKAVRAHAWKEIEKSHKANETVKGLISSRVKGGFTVDIGPVPAFLPGSLVDVKPIRDPGYLEGKELEFKVIKMDKKRNNIVVSRRAVMEESTTAERVSRLGELQEGQEVIGLVKNIVDYGAFVDLGGVDGLLHITDMSWKRVKHPNEVLKVGDEVKVKVLKFDRDKDRVSLGMKQLGEDPWENIERRYPANSRLMGKVTNIADYGCFVEIEDGVEGLVHMSEMDWTNKNIHPSKVVKLGEEVEVMVLEIDEERRRISLGIKQCKANPWDDFAHRHEVGEKIRGHVRSITDFGMFVGLEGDIDGLVHLSDISWGEQGETAVRQYKKGDEVETVILAIDPERERISLGIKQLETDPYAELTTAQESERVYKAKVLEVDTKQATLQLDETLTGIMKIGDFSYDRVKDLRQELKEGEEIEVRIINIDRKTRQIYASHKVLEAKPGEGGTRSMGDQPSKTTLGDLLKEQMKDQSKE